MFNGIYGIYWNLKKKPDHIDQTVQTPKQPYMNKT